MDEDTEIVPNITEKDTKTNGPVKIFENILAKNQTLEDLNIHI